MEKRYQVFVSSTYVDLQDERQKVLQTLMEMDCIPAGMELFPAADEEQWEFIKKVIDDCDYYLLIIGGKYGSIADDGLSYTEKEFDYAVSKGIKVIALIHKQPETLPRNKTESDQEKFEKLEKFKTKVSTGRLVRFWDSSAQIPGEVALSLNKTIKMYPAIGWVRANSTASPELLVEINDLRKQNELLRFQLTETQNNNSIIAASELADFGSSITIHGTYTVNARRMRFDTQYRTWSKDVTWDELFTLLSPYLVENPFENAVSQYLAKYLSGVDTTDIYINDLEVNQQDIFTIRVQMQAFNLINIESELAGTKWGLTKQGNDKMISARVIKKT